MQRPTVLEILPKENIDFQLFFALLIFMTLISSQKCFSNKRTFVLFKKDTETVVDDLHQEGAVSFPHHLTSFFKKLIL